METLEINNKYCIDRSLYHNFSQLIVITIISFFNSAYQFSVRKKSRYWKSYF